MSVAEAKPLSNRDITKLATKLGLEAVYRNTYPDDRTPNKMKAIEFSVFNLQHHDEGGTHWVGAFNRPGDSHVYYFDPLGFPPDPPLRKYLETSGKPLKNNTKRIQSSVSALCGYYVLEFALHLTKGKSFQSYLDTYSAINPKGNDELLVKRLRSVEQSRQSLNKILNRTGDIAR